ncbi:hypothetical protein [Paludifilum halophilum]|uniref:Uncharacterized protein n=1 Tax=Paludifilum halophilum TaxID=1642702 RepID=A0A235BC65_9BACL|nr:hypothetical protein [Paludifilum halophilum]OYD09880.1 hypothetical protein CHM34_02575 [Paludifilum halophilum]
MLKLDIQIDIACEYKGVDKEAFHRDLQSTLEKYFELNSIHIRKEIHTVEVEKINLKEQQEKPDFHDTVDIERKPLVTVFHPADEQEDSLAGKKKQPNTLY